MGHKIPLQFWVGGYDVNGMLIAVGGWHVGSQIAEEKAEPLAYAIEAGWVHQRQHWFPHDKEWAPAYELTDAGLQRLEDSYGPKARASAERTRQWYRDRVAEAVKPESMEKT